MFRQMEKLVMLLDIYEEEVVGVHSVWEKITDKEETRIISKKFWFIKWLVENEKVEWNNKDIAIKEWILWKSIDNYHSLLMALAIQDEPINFLISILK